MFAISDVKHRQSSRTDTQTHARAHKHTEREYERDCKKKSLIAIASIYINIFGEHRLENRALALRGTDGKDMMKNPCTSSGVGLFI